jgi:hypothetical protein
MANKVSCSSGRSKLIDPNSFQGQSSSNNIPVQLEDLNISIQLETYKKGRSVLIADNDDKRTESNKTLTVTFIDGQTLPSGKKALTTKFTDLTTVFDATNPNNDEALGITSIDIDFNSSYAPLVTINFIDVRGSAIFQNEENLKQGKNKYSTFFELPYPLYQLTVKGYYGRPVKYCLHMTKFNSRFNSQTGNFEITASFIGYTYAMLSDMLIGYLKAIANTTYGKDIYKNINDERAAEGLNSVLTINELIKRLSEIDIKIAKIASDSSNSQAITNIDEKVNKLKEIEIAIQELGYDLEKNSFSFGTREKYPIIVAKNSENVQILSEKKEEQDLRKVSEDLTNLNQSSSTIRYAPNPVDISKNDINQLPQADKDFIQVKISTYEDKVSKLIVEYNKIGGTSLLDFNDFTSVSSQHFFNNLTKNEFDETKRTPASDEVLKGKLINAPNAKKNTEYDVFTYKVKQFSEILFSEGYQTLAGDILFSIHDMTYAYDKITESLETLSVERQSNLQNLASEIDTNISSSLGISPTIRNIIEVFTTAVEVFLKAIYNVSVKAEDSENQERKKELKKLFGNDVSNSSDLVNSDNIFAWPEYIESTETGYVEKYLGSVKNLNKNAINELVFIDELHKAFLSGAKDEKNYESELITKYKNWIPINPLDTKIFINESPYERLKNDKSDINKVIVTMLTRAMTFLGYTNKNLTDDDINKMSTFEANLINRLPDSTLKAAMAKKTVDEILKFQIDINSKAVSVLGVGGNNNYFYNLLFEGASDIEKLLPITYKEYNQWDKNETYTIGQTNNYFAHSPNYYSKPNTFLTNYSPNDYLKPNDGGLYVQILSKDQYGKQIDALVEEGVNTESVILLDKTKNDGSTISDNLTSAGYNTFGGQYGIQEYSKMNFGSTETNGGDLTDLPLMYVFYGDSFAEGKTLNNGLGNSSSTQTGFEYDIEKDQNYDLTFRDSNDDELNPTTRKGDFDNFGKNRTLFNALIKKPSEANISYPYIKQETWVKNDNEYYKSNNSFSLFGSYWYYAQTNEASKALLFLNTLPFNNTLIKDENRVLTNGFNNDSDGNQIFSNVTIEAPEIINLFNQKAGFIRAPRLWCAYIGGILWRAEQESDTIVWDVNGDSIFPGIDDLRDIPSTKDYIKNITPSFSIKSVKVQVNEILLNLPTQVKEEFKRVFFDFVNGSDTNVYTSWPTLKNKLEIWDKSAEQFKQTIDNIYYNIDASGQFIKGNLFEFKNLENYNIVTVNTDYEDTIYAYTMYLELYGSYNSTDRKNPNEPSVIKLILDAMMQDVVIANNNYKIWEKPNKQDATRSPISVDSNILQKYLTNLLTNVSGNYQDAKTEEDSLEQELFATTNENVIKLQLYRTCKNIYDKWVGGAKNENELLFQCGTTTDPIPRRNSDTELAKTLKKNNPSFIDSFRFVSRSFNDIGDKFYVNPIPIIRLIRDNPNISFYDITSRLLSDNNFDFIALPSFIDYTDELELSKVFEPLPNYEKAVEGGICGPSFVCVYVGQTSKNLDFNNNPKSYYANDGFDFRCNGASLINLPNDFSSEKKLYEDPVAVFAVNFGQQNQNIFKDIVLDQSEFGETAESLKVTDDISVKGSQNNVTLAGQNIYNVYSVRSYKAEVEMMGNAMIQPMMYFQLNNIPMFHGAYMITHVKHSIKPNYMSTHFTGVRIKKAETPLLTASDLYMKMLESLGFESNDDLPSQSTTGDYTLGSNCGEYTLPKQIVDGVGGFEATKPIRDLVATVESRGNYDAYNNGTAGKKGTTTYYPSQMTVADIKAKQAMTDNNRIFAVGKYQLIPSTFISMVKALGFNDTDVFNADKQEKAGEWLIIKGAGYRKGLVNYFGKGSLGGESDLQNAISDLALEFASFPTYYGTTTNQAFTRTNPIGYNSKTALYGGSAGNPAESKFCAQDVAKALIATWKNLNPGLEPTFTYDKIVSVYNQEQNDTNLKPENKNIVITPPSEDDIQFYKDILTSLGAPITDENLKFFYAWRQAEGAKAAWNPFNTTKKSDGATNYNCAPVKNYANRDLGVKATVDTLKLPYYTNILNGLINNVGAYTLSTYIKDLTSWSTKYGINKVLAGERINPPAIQTTTVQVKTC